MEGRIWMVTVGAVAGVLAVSGCSDALEPEDVAITGTDYAFEGVPERVAAGSTLTFTNASDVEAHEVVAIRVPEDVELSVAELIALEETELDALLPPEPPAAVLIAGPGEDGFAVVGDGVLEEPGRYALVCFVPVGADPAVFLAGPPEGEEGPPDVEGGAPHAFEGMIADLVVE